MLTPVEAEVLRGLIDAQLNAREGANIALSNFESTELLRDILTQVDASAKKKLDDFIDQLTDFGVTTP